MRLNLFNSDSPEEYGPKMCIEIMMQFMVN